MDEYSSPNYTEYSYDRKAQGKNLAARILLVCFYAAFLLGGFLFCYISRVPQFFALAPFLLWIVVFFTWRYVSYDFYYEFDRGFLTLGKIRGGRRGRKKIPSVKIHVKDAEYAAPYSVGKEKISSVKRVYDYTSGGKTKESIIIVWHSGGKKTAVLFEGAGRIADLIASFCPNAEGLKGLRFHE